MHYLLSVHILIGLVLVSPFALLFADDLQLQSIHSCVEVNRGNNYVLN
jgi:hypothetical protein